MCSNSIVKPVIDHMGKMNQPVVEDLRGETSRSYPFRNTPKNAGKIICETRGEAQTETKGASSSNRDFFVEDGEIRIDARIMFYFQCQTTEIQAGCG